MDYSLLRVWLGLPAGHWPADHYTLLGLPRGECDPQTLEALALAGMARLRPHQLLHPELVSEGMNRLAQALICLSDPLARAAYDQELDLPAGAGATHPSGTEESILGFPIPTDDALPSPSDSLPSEPTSQEELTAAGEERPVEARLVKVRKKQRKPKKVVPAEVVWEPEIAPPAAVPGETEIVVPPSTWKPASRRQLFIRLVLLRRYLEIWLKLKPALADPREPLDRPVRVLIFLEAAEELRPILHVLPGLIGEPGCPGELVAALVCQPHVISTVRMLLPDQRRAVATDWRTGERTIIQEQKRLRELARAGRSVRRRQSRRRCVLVRRLVRWFVQTPEIIVLLLALVLLVHMWVRSRTGS